MDSLIKQELVLDITSLFTIHLLNIQEKLTDNYNVHISTSEYFVLKRIQDNAKSNLSSEMVVGYDRNDEFCVSNANYKVKYNFISKIISWIDKKCKITESSSLFKISKKEKENINQIPYSNIKENILLAYDNRF